MQASILWLIRGVISKVSKITLLGCFWVACKCVPPLRCTANPTYNDMDFGFVKDFLEQELGFAVLIVLITTCLGKDDWKAELSQLQLLVVAAVVLYKTHGSCIRCENLRSSCITLQYEVLQHLDTCCEQLTTHLKLQRSQCQDRCCNKEELFRS